MEDEETPSKKGNHKDANPNTVGDDTTTSIPETPTRPSDWGAMRGFSSQSSRNRRGMIKPEHPKVEDYELEFLHPALGPARIVWIPRDTLGLGEAEERENRAARVDVSTRFAFMNEVGHVDVEGPPPGEEHVAK